MFWFKLKQLKAFISNKSGDALLWTPSMVLIQWLFDKFNLISYGNGWLITISTIPDNYIARYSMFDGNCPN